jgi:DNA-binding Lrp family transcriptional regulator
MAKPPVDTTYFKKVGPNYIFSPKESVFINAYNKNLTNKQLAERFGASETAIEGFIRKLKAKGLIPDIKKIRPDDLAKYKKAIRRLKNWANNPTLKNWSKYFGTTSVEGKKRDIGRQIRAYFTGEKILNPASKEILDYLKIKEQIPLNAQNVLKTFTTDFFKTNRTQFGALDASKSIRLKESFEKVIAINKEFKKNPEIDLNTLTKNLYKNKFTKGDIETKLRLATTTSDDVAKYLQALTPAADGKGFARNVPKGMASQWSPPTGAKLAAIMSYIGSQTDGFRFREGTLRKYKFSIRDAALNLAPNTTENLRNILKGTPGVIDEVVGLSSTFKNAPGYTEFMQLIPDDINKKKAVIDNKFRVVLENALQGEFEGVEKFNKESKAFAKKFKIDTPLLNPGGDPTKDILYFDQMSPEGKANVLKLADKGKGFTVKTTTLPLKPMTERFQAVSQDPTLFNKLVNAVDNAPQVCRKILNYQTGGISQTCAVALQEDPVGAAEKLKDLDAQSGPLAKVKNAALGFLRSGGVKTFGVGAGIGAAVGLVKQFRNDDPTSYLSNEDQQKNMLVDMVTQPISTDMTRPDILDYQLPAVGASIAASTALGAPSTIKVSRDPKSVPQFKSRGAGVEQKGLIRTGGRVLGKGLGIAASPGVLAPLAAMDIADQISEGDSLADIGTNPFNYTYPIFAEQTPRLTRGLPSTFRKFARLGMSKPALRLLSRAGIAGLGASLAIQGIGLLDD